MKPMGKLNASLGENNLLRFLQDQNALVWLGPALQLFLRSLRQVPHVLNTKEILYSCGDYRGLKQGVKRDLQLAETLNNSKHQI